LYIDMQTVVFCKTLAVSKLKGIVHTDTEQHVCQRFFPVGPVESSCVICSVDFMVKTGIGGPGGSEAVEDVKTAVQKEQSRNQQQQKHGSKGNKNHSRKKHGNRRSSNNTQRSRSSDHFTAVQYDVNGFGGYPYGYHHAEGYHGNYDASHVPRINSAPLYMAQTFVPTFGWDMFAQQHGHVKYDVGHEMRDREPKVLYRASQMNCEENRRRPSLPKPKASHGDGQHLPNECTVAPVSTLGRLWTSSALPAIEDKKDDAPDLERFLRAATPRFRISTDPNSLRDLKLLDVWKYFERISANGIKCPTLGGPRGPSTCFFVPFLSSVQIFEPTHESDDVALSFPDGLDAWPSHMKRSFSWSAKNHVGERLPLYQQIMELCEDEGMKHVLTSSKIADVHPYSWFAVAWYPLYRIPEAPLTARFLTFHSIAPLWEAVMQGMADQKIISALHSQANLRLPEMGRKDGSTTSSTTPKGVTSFPGSDASEPTTHGDLNNGASKRDDKTDEGSDTASVTASHGSSSPPSQAHSRVEEEDENEEKHASCAATTISSTASLSKLELPPVGLCWHTSTGNSINRRRLPAENWTDTMVKLNASDQTRLSSGDSLPGSTNACVVSVSSGYVVVKKDYPISKGGPLSWDIQLEELAEGAKRLALGLGIQPLHDNAVSTLQGEDICPDYQFFVART
jgi:hypothetical protein